MTKTKLNWRLTDLPTAGEVAELVDSEVITKEEARDILFNEKEATSTKEVEALKEQIKFMDNLLTGLIQGMNRGKTYNLNQTFVPVNPVRYWFPTISMQAYGSLNSGTNIVSFSGSAISGKITGTSQPL